MSWSVVPLLLILATATLTEAGVHRKRVRIIVPYHVHIIHKTHYGNYAPKYGYGGKFHVAPHKLKGTLLAPFLHNKGLKNHKEFEPEEEPKSPKVLEVIHLYEDDLKNQGGGDGGHVFNDVSRRRKQSYGMSSYASNYGGYVEYKPRYKEEEEPPRKRPSFGRGGRWNTDQPGHRNLPRGPYKSRRVPLRNHRGNGRPLENTFKSNRGRQQEESRRRPDNDERQPQNHKFEDYDDDYDYEEEVDTWKGNVRQQDGRTRNQNDGRGKNTFRNTYRGRPSLDESEEDFGDSYRPSSGKSRGHSKQRGSSREVDDDSDSSREYENSRSNTRGRKSENYRREIKHDTKHRENEGRQQGKTYKKEEYEEPRKIVDDFVDITQLQPIRIVTPAQDNRFYRGFANFPNNYPTAERKPNEILAENVKITIIKNEHVGGQVSNPHGYQQYPTRHPNVQFFRIEDAKRPQDVRGQYQQPHGNIPQTQPIANNNYAQNYDYRQNTWNAGSQHDAPQTQRPLLNVNYNPTYTNTPAPDYRFTLGPGIYGDNYGTGYGNENTYAPTQPSTYVPNNYYTYSTISQPVDSWQNYWGYDNAYANGYGGQESNIAEIHVSPPHRKEIENSKSRATELLIPPNHSTEYRPNEGPEDNPGNHGYSGSRQINGYGYSSLVGNGNIELTTPRGKYGFSLTYA